MKRHASRARQQSARRPKAQPRRYANRADVDEHPTPHEWRTFDASIQILAEETESLSTLMREWLVRSIEAIVQAVKQQLAGNAVPPERQLLPPKEFDDVGPSRSQALHR
jgi:hypothetical protein